MYPQPNEQLPPSEYDAPMDLRKSTLDWDDLQRRLPRWEAMLAEIKRLAAQSGIMKEELRIKKSDHS